MGSRRVTFVKATANPDSVWVSQQARNLLMDIGGDPRFLLRDRDAKFSGPFDEVFRSEGVRIVGTPFRSPKAKRVRGAVGAHGPPGVSGPSPDPSVLAEFVGH